MDCRENGMMVCANGRITRIVQSLAHLDNDPAIGELKTKESIRNELFSNVGNFVAKESKKLSKEDEEDYINDKDTKAVKKYKDKIKLYIQDAVNSYKLPEDESKLLITECLAVI